MTVKLDKIMNEIEKPFHVRPIKKCLLKNVYLFLPGKKIECKLKLL